MKVLPFLMLCSVSVAQADDFRTITGKEYKNATVSRVEPDGIVLTNKAGISKVYFTELPKDVQERFGYDSQRAADYSAQQSAGLDQARKEQAETSRREAEATQKANQYQAEQQTRQNELRALKAATRNCRGKKTTYFSVSVRRRNRDQRTSEVRTTRLFAALRTRKHRSCRFSRVT